MSRIDAAIKWLHRSKWGAEYESHLRGEPERGCSIIEQCDEELLYVTISHTSIEEFKKEGWAVLRLYRAGKGYVCRAKTFYKNENTVCIGDIESRIKGRGYGSRVLSSLIKICRQLKVETIMGEISEVDSNHLEDLRRFYTRHGFKVTMYDGAREGLMMGKVECELSDHSDP